MIVAGVDAGGGNGARCECSAAAILGARGSFCVAARAGVRPLRVHLCVGEVQPERRSTRRVTRAGTTSAWGVLSCPQSKHTHAHTHNTHTRNDNNHPKHTQKQLPKTRPPSPPRQPSRRRRTWPTCTSASTPCARRSKKCTREKRSLADVSFYFSARRARLVRQRATRLLKLMLIGGKRLNAL